MEDPWLEACGQAKTALKDRFPDFAEEIDGEFLGEPPKPEMGDISSAVCFSIAKKLRKNPSEIAKSFSLDKNYTLISEAKPVGGYLNFFINRDEFSNMVLESVMSGGKDYGSSKYFSGRVVVEFPSVNPNKPWHIGHARNAVIGDTISRIFGRVGYEVVRLDYINDLGLQVAKTLWGLLNMKPTIGSEKADHFFGKLYVEAEEKCASDPEVEREVQSLVGKMEAGGKEAAMGRELAEKCVLAQYQTASRLNVGHDMMVWESDLVSSGLLAGAMEKMRACPHIKNLAEGEKAGCLVADLSQFPEFSKVKEPYFVLTRSDGTATYAAKDIAFHLWKFGVLPDRLKYARLAGIMSSYPKGAESGRYGPASTAINIIGAEQAHPQKLVQLTLSLVMGGEARPIMGEKAKLFHVSYEHVWLPEGKFSGRKGTWLGYTVDEVLDEATSRALKEVEKRVPDSAEKEKIASAVGSAAIRYALLKTAPEKKITFRWEEALSFEGDAAPYLQYAHARACRILENADSPPEFRPAKFGEEAELALIKTISRWPSLLSGIVRSMKQEAWGTRIAVNGVAEYAYRLATDFSRFYTNCRVIGSPQESERLLLVTAFRQTIANVLDTLGIEAIERM